MSVSSILCVSNALHLKRGKLCYKLLLISSNTLELGKKTQPGSFSYASLQYMREYPTYGQIAVDFGIHESSLMHRSRWIEETLVQNGFTISKITLNTGDTVLIDTTEVNINCPKKPW